MGRLLRFLTNSVLALFGIFIFVYAFAFNSTSGWTLFYFILFFYLLLLLSISTPLYLIRPKVPLHLKLYEQQTHLKVQLTRRKPRFFFYSNLIVSILDKNEVLGVSKNEYWLNDLSRDIVIKMVPLKRGYYANLALYLSVTDLFGLFGKGRKKEIHSSLLVLPEKRPNDAGLLIKIVLHGMLDPLQRAEMDSYNVQNYHVYRPGDAFGKVDWKLSAKGPDLIVKEVEKEVTRDYVLLFWGERTANFESMLSLFFSTFLYLRSKVAVEALLQGELGIERPNSELETFGSFQGTSAANLEQQLPNLPVMTKKDLLIFLPAKTKQTDQVLKFYAAHNRVVAVIGTDSIDVTLVSPQQTKRVIFNA